MNFVAFRLPAWSLHNMSVLLLVVCALLCSSSSSSSHSEPQPAELEWWQQAVIYQIYPRSFQDSDGDGTGDLKGIQCRLDYLQELGVGAVWLNPFYTSPMVDFGYDVSNFTDIDPIFGTLDDFRALVAEMHRRGINVIVDFIPNHSSDQHEWFPRSVAREEPYTDFYTWLDPKYDDVGNRLPPNNWVSSFGGSMWEWNEARGQFYLHQYSKEQPDLRLENPLVLQALLDAMEFWVELGVDGFRMDAVPRLFEDQTFPDELPSPTTLLGTPPNASAYWEHRHTFNLPQVLPCLAKFRKLLDRKSAVDRKQRVMLAEAYIHSLPDLIKYYGSPDMPMANFPFNFGLSSLPATGLTADTVKRVIDGWMEAMPAGAWANWLVGNHDKPRVADRFGPELVDAVNMIVLMLPGTAVTYYGEELGMRGHADISYKDTKDVKGRQAGPERFRLYSRDPQRSPMQWDDSPNAGFSSGKETWLPMHPNYRTLSVEAQHTSAESHLKVYKALVALRQTPEWIHGGLETRVLGEDGSVFGFTRSLRDETYTRGILVLANLATREATIDATIFEGVPSTGVVHIRSVSMAPAGESETAVVDSNVSLNSLALQQGSSLVIRYLNEDDGGKSIWSLAACTTVALTARALSRNN